MDAPVPRRLPVLALLLIGSLLLAGAGHASAVTPVTAPFAFEEELEPEEEEGEFEEEPGEEFGEGECEIAEEELEEGLLTPADVEEICAAEEEALEASQSGNAGACPLRSATAHASIRGNRLKLTIGYTTREPMTARIETHAGKRKLGSYRRRLGRSGVLRLTKRLGKRRPQKIRIRIEAPACKRFRVRPATVR